MLEHDQARPEITTPCKWSLYVDNDGVEVETECEGAIIDPHLRHYKFCPLCGRRVEMEKGLKETLENNVVGKNKFLIYGDYSMIARICHEVNKAYCESFGDSSQPHWDVAPQWQKDSAIKGVELHMANKNVLPSISHESWVAQKIADGWGYGEVKNEAMKTHPCIVPFDQLPQEQKAKDYIFKAICDVFKQN